MSWTTDPGRVDLHVHSWVSDGTMGPEELYRAAQARGVTLLAICDHDALEGSRALLGIRGSVRCISGVELDALEGGVNFHILGYGFDVDDGAFGRFVQMDRDRLEEVSTRLVTKMEHAGEPVSLQEFKQFTYDRSGGGWTALHYFVAKGLADSLQSAMTYYGVYGSSYTQVAFPTVAEACAAIHAAGGRAVLAHPGVTLPYTGAEPFRATLEQLLTLGLDGIECHYPTHSTELTELCLALCRERGLLVTCGSDCHGSFGDTQVGELSVPEDSLTLGPLL